jgi:hypothetical protein
MQSCLFKQVSRSSPILAGCGNKLIGSVQQLADTRKQISPSALKEVQIYDRHEKIQTCCQLHGQGNRTCQLILPFEPLGCLW